MLNYNTNYASLETFDSAKKAILDMLKKFYPNDYKNFESGKAGSMIVDSFAFIGEILHFTSGQYFLNSFPQTVTNKQHAANLAQWYGLKNIGATLPWVAIKMTISVSAVGGLIQSAQIPKILPGATIYSNDRSTPDFILANKVDFTKVPSNKWTKYYNSDGTLKRVEISEYGYCTSYTRNTVTHTVTTSNNAVFEKFYEYELTQPNIQQIVEITDQNGNKYYEVDSLVQDTVFEYVLNENDVQNNIPYLLFDQKAPYRFIRKQFVSNIDEKVYTKIIFGNVSETEYQSKLFNANPNDLILPESLFGLDNGSAEINQLNNKDFDPQNMLLIDSLGIGPSNGDILTIKYISGDGSNIKVPAGKLNRIKNITWSWNDSTLQTDIISSLIINNDEPSAGGRAPLSTEELKHYTISYGLNQNRAVTPSDYSGIIMSMPEYLGRPDKIYTSRSLDTSDPFRIDIFMLSIDSNGNYFDPTKNPAFIHNMRLYLKKYKSLNDLIVLRAGKIINSIIQFDIQVSKNFRLQEVSYNALSFAKQYMAKENWYFGKHFECYDFMQYISNNVNGIISISNVKLNKPTNANNYPNNYSNQLLEFNHKENKYIVPTDSIIEIRNLDNDIIVNADILGN